MHAAIFLQRAKDGQACPLEGWMRGPVLAPHPHLTSKGLGVWEVG